MKTLLCTLFSLSILLGLTACGGAPQVSSGTSSNGAEKSSADSAAASPASSGAADAGPSAAGNKTLVVYFSVLETTEPENMTAEEENSVVVIDGEVLGNTQYAAYVIAEATGGDIFRIEPKTPYTTDHEALVNLAKEEQTQNARPALNANIERLSEYDTIFIGYPTWWSDMPMILYSFFETNDFSGKTILPFNTHGGSGFSGTIDTIAALEPGADVRKEGFTVSRNEIQDAGPAIIGWLDKLEY